MAHVLIARSALTCGAVIVLFEEACEPKALAEKQAGSRTEKCSDLG